MQTGIYLFQAGKRGLQIDQSVKVPSSNKRRTGETKNLIRVAVLIQISEGTVINAVKLPPETVSGVDEIHIRISFECITIHLLRYTIGLKNSRHFFIQSKVKLKAIVTCSSATK